MNKKGKEVIVVGGGLAGLAATMKLAEQGCTAQIAGAGGHVDCELPILIHNPMEIRPVFLEVELQCASQLVLEDSQQSRCT